ncbi:hypothetical protein L914_05001 [Phytophthora nicotianae]|nr:hypothetical protein L914_05001 [Phytophthora nicotianae]
MSFRRDFKDGKWPFGGQGGPDVVPSPTGAACVKISEILASADEHAGEYSFGGLAHTLPVISGLFVNDVGIIPFPLAPDHAEKLISRCEKSPFGHNMDTKMDENVRKSWQLQPDQVEFRNPLWQEGLDKLTKTIATRLGYKGVALRGVLYKLLVYGEGGHFLKHQDTEKEDGMIATLVVQPPSTHEGGDLIVYRNGQVEHRHDFGKADGTAAYFPHYAVHYSDAEHALEEVTIGYRLVLVYSICLPKSLSHVKRDPNVTMTDKLANVINSMGPENEHFALLLSHEYTKKSIGEMGTAALKGIDCARFRMLEEVNNFVLSDKKLRFFIAKLVVKVDAWLDEYGWDRCGYQEALHWYNTTGESLGHIESSLKFNFLNPGRESLLQMWKSYGDSEDAYTGNDGPVKRTKYSRFAIVAWPANLHLMYMTIFVSAEIAVEELLRQRPVGAVCLRDLLTITTTKDRWGKVNALGYMPKASLRFCRSFFELLVDTKDVELAKMFITNFCPNLGGLAESTTLVPVIANIVRTFAWDDIGDTLLALFQQHRYDTKGVSDTELLLLVASHLDGGFAKTATITAAMAKAEYAIRFSEAVEVLWQVVRSGDDQNFEMVTTKIQKRDPRELGPFVEVCLHYTSDYDRSSEQFKALQMIAGKRMEWLKGEIQRLDKVDKVFSWRMPYAEGEDQKEIEPFLRGPEESTTVKGIIMYGGELREFIGLYEAKRYAKTILEDLKECSFRTEVGEDRIPFVAITKNAGVVRGRPEEAG